MAELVVVWSLRGLLGLVLLWLLVPLVRSLRALRPQRYGIRPSTAGGLAGSYTPTVSVVVPTPGGRAPRWIEAIDYPAGRYEVIVVAPRAVRSRIRVPDGCRVVLTRGHLVAAGLRSARGHVVLVVPARVAAPPSFVARMVAPLVDPFVGAVVGHVAAGRPDAGLAALVDDLERLSRRGVRVGQATSGGAIAPEGEPFAMRASTIADVGGLDVTSPRGDAALVLAAYARGYAVAFAEEAAVLSPPPSWHELSMRAVVRTWGMRQSWRRVRRMLRRTKVLEGPEKTDVRWSGRGTSMPLWVLVGWLLALALRLADPGWAPNVLAGALVLITAASPLTLTPFPIFTTAAVQSGRLRMLAFLPWLPLLALGSLWTGTGAALASAFGVGRSVTRWRRGRRR